ncbi:MAG: NUDIX domain-containing protein [Planctomycetota bacterium]
MAWHEDARFCPLCGSSLGTRAIEGVPRKACPDCRYVLYPNPGTGVAALVVAGRRILFVRRAIEPYRGSWGFPAGFQEYAETPQECIVRETREETGLGIRLLGLHALLYTRDDPRKRANLLVFRAVAEPGEPVVGDDVLEVGWFALDRPPDEIAFENNRLILEDLRLRFPEGPLDGEPGGEARIFCDGAQ